MFTSIFYDELWNENFVLVLLVNLSFSSCYMIFCQTSEEDQLIKRHLKTKANIGKEFAFVLSILSTLLCADNRYLAHVEIHSCDFIMFII